MVNKTAISIERGMMMSVREIDPKETTRSSAFDLWMKAPNPMVTFFKTYDVMPLVAASKNRDMKFNMLLDFCIGKAAASIKEFYLLPVGNKLMQYDKIAVNTLSLQEHTRSIKSKFCVLLCYFQSAYHAVRFTQVPCRAQNLSLFDSVTSTMKIFVICKADD